MKGLAYPYMGFEQGIPVFDIPSVYSAYLARTAVPPPVEFKKIPPAKDDSGKWFLLLIAAAKVLTSKNR